jgi:hypothetical protein
MAALCLQQIAIAELSGAPTVQSFIRLAVRLATEINKEVSFKGAMKMAQVQGVLRMALAEPVVREKLSPELIATLTAMVDTVVPEAITIAVQASRGEISLKKPTVGCVASLCGLFCRAAMAAAPLVLPPAPAPSPDAEAPVKEAVEQPQETIDAKPAETPAPEPESVESKESSVSPPEETTASPAEENQQPNTEPVEQ